MSKFGHRTVNWFEAVINKLGGEERADAFLRGELIVRMAEKFFVLWRTVAIGVRQDTEGYQTALEDSCSHVGPWAESMLGKAVFSTETGEEVRLVETHSSYFFPDMGTLTFKEFHDCAQKFGLKHFPADDQWIHLGMKPITDLIGAPNGGCSLGYDERGLLLRTNWRRGDGQPRLVIEWVFKTPSQATL